MTIILSILLIVVSIYAIVVTSRYIKSKNLYQVYLKTLKNELSWHEEDRQDITSKPYKVSDKDGFWIGGPGLDTPAYFPNGMGKIENIRDLMNHAYRQRNN